MKSKVCDYNLMEMISDFDDQFSFIHIEETPSFPKTGASSPIKIGDKFREVVINKAREAGFFTFEVFINGKKIDKRSCPEIVEPGMKIVLKYYPFTRQQ